MAAAYSGMAVFGALVLLESVVLGVLFLAVLLSASGRWRRWRRTRRAFCSLPMHKQQELVAKWWIGAGTAWIFAIAASRQLWARRDGHVTAYRLESAGRAARPWETCAMADRVDTYLAGLDVKCVRCGYSLRGIESRTCPECTRQGVDEMLVRFLAERNAPCPGCGYELHELARDRCPECDQRLRIGVLLVEPRMGPLMTSLISLAIGIGASGVWLAFFAVFSMFSVAGLPKWVWMAPLLAFLVEGMAIGALTARSGRRWFASLRHDGQAWVAAGSIGLTLLAAVTLVVAALRL